MKRSKTPSYCVTVRFDLSDGQYRYLEKAMSACEKVFNACMKHARRRWYYMQQNKEFMDLRQRYFDASVKKERIALAEEINHNMIAYGIDKNALQKFANVHRHKCLHDKIGSQVIQNVADDVYTSINKTIFCDTEAHYKKRNTLHSFSGKSNANIFYDPETHTASVFKKRIPLKPLRKNDRYIAKALHSEVKYCRVVKEPAKGKNKYYLQIILKGSPPPKCELGDQIGGMDQGLSTAAIYTDKKASFHVLAEGVEGFEKEIAMLQRKLEHKKRCNNPDHYNADGTYKKGCKDPWVEAKAMKRIQQQLLNAHRRKRVFVAESHGHLANELVRLCKEIHIEQMNWRGFAKRSKKATEKSEKTVITKSGKTVKKNKRKRRAGKSIYRRAPGLFEQMLKIKMQYYGGDVIEVANATYCASQYDPITQEKNKLSLNQRTTEMNGKLAQRDIKAAYLLRYSNDTYTLPDFEAAKQNVETFFKRQDEVIEEIKRHGDITKNFGLRDFLKAEKI